MNGPVLGMPAPRPVLIYIRLWLTRAIGPIIGGFVFQNLGWRWNNWLVLILAGVLGLLAVTHPETYPPVLLRRRAERLRRETGDARYMSRFCYRDGQGDVLPLLAISLKRPVVMLFTEPMWSVPVALLSPCGVLCSHSPPLISILPFLSSMRGTGTVPQPVLPCSSPPASLFPVTALARSVPLCRSLLCVAPPVH